VIATQMKQINYGVLVFINLLKSEFYQIYQLIQTGLINRFFKYTLMNFEKHLYMLFVVCGCHFLIPTSIGVFPRLLVQLINTQLSCFVDNNGILFVQK